LSRCVYDFIGAFGGTGLHLDKLDAVSLGPFALFVCWEIVPAVSVLYHFRRISSNDQGLGAKVYNWVFPHSASVSSNEVSKKPIVTMNGASEEQYKVLSNGSSLGDLEEDKEWKRNAASPIIVPCFDDPQRYDSDTEVAEAANLLSSHSGPGFAHYDYIYQHSLGKR